MRITYLHQYFTTPDGATGTRSYELARRMVARGHRVTVVCSDAQLPPGTGDAVDGISLRVIPVAYANEMATAARLRAFILFALRASIVAARTPADVVYASSTPLTIVLPGIVGRLARRAPLVFEVRDLWPDVPIRLGVLRGRLPIAIARGLELLAYRASAAVVALSPGMADGVAARGIARSRIHVIPNGCDVALFDVPESAGEPVRASVPGLAPGAPLIVHVGALGEVNDVGWLAELAARLRPLRPDARFLVVGRGRDRERVLARARRAGVLDETFFVRDPIPKRSVPALLAAATVSCAISVRAVEANSSNKLFDTLAAGRPALINYGGWQQALLEDSGAGIVVPPDDLDRAAALLAAFLDDPLRQRDARAAAARLARERFDRDRQARELIELLESVGSAPKR
jgi:glycosyltransferase involved in cell wall biosynthesis